MNPLVNGARYPRVFNWSTYVNVSLKLVFVSTEATLQPPISSRSASPLTLTARRGLCREWLRGRENTMQLRHVLILALVIGLLVPVAGASTPVSTPHGDGSSATASDDGGERTDPANYTRLYIEDRYHRLRLKPGGEDTVTVTVVNVDDEAVTIDPQLVTADPRSRSIDDGWVSIDTDETTLAPGDEVEVTVTASIPETAELGDYRAQLAFTDERLTHPGQPPRPVHATQLSVDVWREPTVRLVAGRHVNTQVEAGASHTHEIVVENTGDEAVPVSPELDADDRNRCYEPCATSVERSWFAIDAPTEIAPGETETIEVTISPPEDADRGRYHANLDLGITDPARAERDDHWQRVRLGFQVWQQPDQPFETTFAVSDDAAAVTLTLSPRQANRYGSQTGDEADPADFDVEFVSPAGEVVEPERVEVSDNGFVDLSGERREVVADEDYAVRGNGHQFVYRVDEPAAGSWTVRIMPHNTVGFGYEIVRNESEG